MVKSVKKLRAGTGKKNRASVKAAKKPIKAKKVVKRAKKTAIQKRETKSSAKARPKPFIRKAIRAVAGKTLKMTSKKSLPRKAGSKPVGGKGAKKQKLPLRKPKVFKKKEEKGITVAAKPAKAEAPQVKKAMSKELEEVLAKADARHWLIQLGGENSLDVIKNLPMMSNDEELAKKLKIKVSDVRASLNKMHNEGLVAYVRDKNSETGWYSYAWVLNEDRIKRWVGERHAQHNAYRPKEGMDFYFCKDCGPQSVLRFEDAHEHSFKCPACSSALDFLDEEKFEQIRKMREPER